jgi:hypothetical protein
MAWIVAHRVRGAISREFDTKHEANAWICNITRRKRDTITNAFRHSTVVIRPEDLSEFMRLRSPKRMEDKRAAEATKGDEA